MVGCPYGLEPYLWDQYAIDKCLVQSWNQAVTLGHDQWEGNVNIHVEVCFFIDLF